MVALKISRDGFAMNFSNDQIAGVAGPRPGDVETLSYVFVAGYSPIATLEPECHSYMGQGKDDQRHT